MFSRFLSPQKHPPSQKKKKNKQKKKTVHAESRYTHTHTHTHTHIFTQVTVERLLTKQK